MFKPAAVLALTGLLAALILAPASPARPVDAPRTVWWWDGHYDPSSPDYQAALKALATVARPITEYRQP